MPNKPITRSTVNEQQYSAPEFPKSGFPLSYRRYTSAMLGRIHVNSFHWTMPGDKISGQSRGQFTFNRITTPIISPVNAYQYNIYLPLRPVDRSFKKGITPTKLNAMSANWTMPQCNTRYLVDQIFRAYWNVAYNDASFGQVVEELFSANAFSLAGTYVTLQDNITASTFTGISNMADFIAEYVTKPINNLISNGTRFAVMADNLYLRDALIDIANNIEAKLSGIAGSMPVNEFLKVWLDCLLTPFVGRYSYYAEFKYEFLRPFDIYRLANGYNNLPANATYADILATFSDTPQNEYALRIMYAIWYELWRNVDLEPVSTTLPDWQEWSSTSIFDMSAGGNLLYLIYRIRPWEDDMFVSAQIDDMSRHVYAPIYASSTDSNGYHVDDVNNLDTNNPNNIDHPSNAGHPTPAYYNLSWHDQLSNTTTLVTCPVPANINDVLSNLDRSFVDVYGLDLNTLRQSQMLEKYLKRNYLFGDEYQDRMLAHYNSRVSDMRINKPEILSRSQDGYDMQQEVSNVSTSAGTAVGDRTATATIDINGEQFTTFCEEFGLVVGITTFMPRAMYDGTCPQNYLAKQVDLPLPEFATNNEEFGRKSEIAGSGLASGYLGDAQDNRFMFGRYPAYHAWRSRVDEVGGMFLDEMQDSTFRRFWGMFSDDTTPKLNYFFLHCRPNLNMFANNVAYDTQVYGDIVNECFVERVLPTPVEVI